MRNFLVFWFWPNPPAPGYDSPKVIALLVLCAVLFLGSFGVRAWRRTLSSSMTKTLSSSWPGAMVWFSVTAFIMVVARVESIQFVSMHILWVVWALILASYVAFQFLSFRRRHYVIVKKEKVMDLKERYMPRRKK